MATLTRNTILMIKNGWTAKIIARGGYFPYQLFWTLEFAPNLRACLAVYRRSRSDGYYAAKQCNWAACFCVDPNGNSVEVTTQRPKYAWYYNNFNIICPDLDLGSYEYEVEPADQLLTSQEISNLPDLPHEEDPENTGKTIDELIGGAHNGANHKRLERPIDAETKNTMEHANGDGKQGKSLKPGHQRAAHGCVQWGEPCTVGKTNCCGDSNYDGTCEWRIGTLFKYACGVKSGFPIKLD